MNDDCQNLEVGEKIIRNCFKKTKFKVPILGEPRALALSTN